MQFDNFHNIGNKLVVSNEFFSVVSSKSGGEMINGFLVGGINSTDPYQIRFWGLPENNVFMTNGLIYRIGLRYEFLKHFFITAKLNGMGDFYDVTKLLENTESTEDSYLFNWDNYTVGTGLELSYKSIVGPVSIGVTFNDKYEGIWSHIRFGFVF